MATRTAAAELGAEGSGSGSGSGTGGLVGSAPAAQRRKRVSYEHYDDEDADGGPTPAPAAHQPRPQPAHKRQRLRGGGSGDDNGDDSDGDDGPGFEIVVPPRSSSHAAAYTRTDEHQHSNRPRGNHQQQQPSSARSSLEAEERPNQSLPVARLPPDFNGVPDTGAEYLALVRREAKQAPQYTRAPNPYEKAPKAAPTADEAENNPDSGLPAHAFAKILSSHKTPSAFPDPIWRKYQTQRFAAMRLALQTPRVVVDKDDDGGDAAPDPDSKVRLPDANDRVGWFYLIHGKPAPKGILVTEAEGRELASRPGAPDEDELDLEYFNIPAFLASGRNPTPTLLRRLSQNQVSAVLRLIFDLLPRFKLVAKNHEHNTPYTVEREVLLPLHARWLFALLTALDAHQVSEQLSELRRLARSIIYNIVTDRMVLASDVELLSQMREHCAAKVARRRERQLGLKKAEAAAEAGDSETAAAIQAELGGEEEDDGLVWTHQNEENLHLSLSNQSRLHRESSAWLIFTCIAGFWGQHDLLEEAEAHLKSLADL